MSVAQRPPSERVVASAFAVLVLASVGAFFLAQRLKRATPFVEHLRFPHRISPNGDGRRDTALIRFTLPHTERVRLSIVDSAGDEVRVLVRDRRLRGGRHAFVWNGRTSAGQVAPRGRYRVRVELPKQGRAITPIQQIRLDTRPPPAAAGP